MDKPVYYHGMPGTALGHCDQLSCMHIQCHRSRRAASSICPGCFNQIGYDTSFQDHAPKSKLFPFAHVVCAERMRREAAEVALDVLRADCTKLAGVMMKNRVYAGAAFLLAAVAKSEMTEDSAA